MKKWFSAIVWLFLLCSFVPIVSAQTQCLIQLEEEYAVMAAVLFPNKPDIPENMKDDLERKVYLSRATIRLDGFHGSSYTVEDETAVSKIGNDADAFMINDFNRKNSQTCKMDAAKLLSHIPAGKRVTVISAEEVRATFSAGSGKGGGWDEFQKKYPFAGGITYLSRPGFNENRTKAVIEVNMQAGYEMGVGYLVCLAKSSKTGKWIIMGGDMSRIS